METMSKHSVRKYLMAMLSLIAVSLGLIAQVRPAGAVSHTSPNQQTSPTTLRLAVADANDAPSAPIILAFVEQVQQRSGGSLAIEPVWEAGADTEVEFEQGVIAAVRAGEYELGLAATRAWEEQGVTVFQPLQTPFLIDNDALAIAVANSEVATQMLEGLTASGLDGLAMWPEDLRHPFSVVPGQPLLSPDDFADKTIRTSSMDVAAALVEALGGTPEFLAFEYQGAESGLRQGFSLTGLPVATGNVVFFTKFQVLFANSAAFEDLDETQRTILREAAAAAQQKAIAERPSEAEAAEFWCADGGSIVLASEEQVAAMQTAAQPIIDQIAQNPEHAEVLAALQELKAATSPTPWADACGSQAVLAISNDAEPAWSEGLPPNGTWAVELSVEDIVRMGVLESKAPEWAGSSVYEFNDGQGIYRGEFLDGVVIVCPFVYEVVEDFFRLTYVDQGLDDDACGEQIDDLQWRLDADGLHLHVVTIHDGPPVENTALYEAKPWQQVEEWSEGLPPNGIWMVELSVDDFVERGMLRSVAERDWAGTYIFTLADDEFSFTWISNWGFVAGCRASYQGVGDIVRFTYHRNTLCEGEVTDAQWRLDSEGGLAFHVVELITGEKEIRGIWEAQPWRKISD